MDELGVPQPLPLTIEHVRQGMIVELRRRFSLEEMQAFSALASDHAPLHRDEGFALAQGYKGIVVFGFLVAAPFSGILGDQLPGALTVLHWARFAMAAPVYVGEEILYRVEVKQVSRSSGGVLLDLGATRVDSGEVVLRGQAQCGFRL